MEEKIPSLKKVEGEIFLPLPAEQLLAEIGKQCRKGSHERCGFVMKSGAVVEVANIAAKPRVSFELDPGMHLQMVMHHKDDVLGVFHTHPSGMARPSQRDVQGWPENLSWRYFIVTKNEITEWERDRDDVSGATSARVSA